MRVLETIGSHVPNFVKDVPRVPKCVLRWGSTPKHFLMGSKMKLWTVRVQMGFPKVIGLDIPNLIKDVPNLMKNVPNFVKDVPRVRKYIPKWGSTPNHLLLGF